MNPVCPAIQDLAVAVQAQRRPDRQMSGLPVILGNQLT